MKKHTILIVEDSLTQIELLKNIFLNNGYDVCVALNGADALEKINNSPPTIIISDISMPEMDGYELCRSIKNNKLLNKLPVILLTNLSDPEEVIKSIQAGADCYMTKPYDDHLILLKVQDLITNHVNYHDNAPHGTIDFIYKGKQYAINANCHQILNILVSTYENMINQNKKLHDIEIEQKNLNQQLLKKVEERTSELREIATKDQLTNLLNRFSFESDKELFQNPILLLINLDGFKHINSFYGVHAGDYLLKKVSEKLTHSTPKDINAKIYRLGGDDFGILCENTPAFQHEKLVNKIITEIENDVIIYHDYDIFPSIIIGIAKESPLLEKADMVLKYLKKNARIKYMEYNEHLNLYQNISSNLNTVKLLKNAIKNDSVFSEFQPILDNKTGKIDKYECLIRIKDESGNVLYPVSFLKIAKESKLYASLTEITIKKSFAAFKDNTYTFSINLSIEDILDKSFNDFIRRELNNNAHLGQRIVFEFLESEGIESYEIVLKFIKDMKSYGCKIAIDDFGSGYSNFEHILKLYVDYIKIDASLIKNIDKDINSEIIVETIVNFTKKLNIETVAEYVDSFDVYKKVKELGVDYSQGYFIGRPELEIS
ncbi:MAG: EAL domain-containing protein [Candidatus Kuenenia sp.]|nr:EAL domain-containing protein [Candidatus Kuenenia hertensis]